MADGPAPGQWTGLDGMATSFRDFLGAWDEYRIEVDEYRSLDEYRVLVLQHFGGRGKTSGLELEGMRAQGAHLFHIHGGKVTRLVNYIDRQRALTELGLTPDAGYPPPPRPTSSTSPVASAFCPKGLPCQRSWAECPLGETAEGCDDRGRAGGPWVSPKRRRGLPPPVAPSPCPGTYVEVGRLRQALRPRAESQGRPQPVV